MVNDLLMSFENRIATFCNMDVISMFNKLYKKIQIEAYDIKQRIKELEEEEKNGALFTRLNTNQNSQET